MLDKENEYKIYARRVTTTCRLLLQRRDYDGTINCINRRLPCTECLIPEALRINPGMDSKELIRVYTEAISGKKS